MSSGGTPKRDRMKKGKQTEHLHVFLADFYMIWFLSPTSDFELRLAAESRQTHDACGASGDSEQRAHEKWQLHLRRN